MSADLTTSQLNDSAHVVERRSYVIEDGNVYMRFSCTEYRDGKVFARGHGGQSWAPGDAGYEDALAKAKAAIAADLSKH